MNCCVFVSSEGALYIYLGGGKHLQGAAMLHCYSITEPTSRERTCEAGRRRWKDDKEEETKDKEDKIT